ncbi:MAG: hypothetical protein AAGA54_14700 [Myxococcota bacterium]
MSGGDHSGHCHSDCGDEQLSTGFLPISLALALLVSGLFAFGVVPARCGGSATPIGKHR